MDQYLAEQHIIAQQDKVNGAAVAQLTMKQFEKEPKFDDDSSGSTVDEEDETFDNVFAKYKGTHKPEPSKKRKPPSKFDRTTSLPTQSMPKMQFPKFDGANPKVWKDNCESYFELYQLPEGMWITAAHLHFEGNAAKWYQAYKQTHHFSSWDHFCLVVEEEFGSDDFRSAMNDLLELKQTGTVEDYTTQFQNLQFDITMHNPHYDEMFFTPQYVRGLKDEIQSMVEPRCPLQCRKHLYWLRFSRNWLRETKANTIEFHNNSDPIHQPR